MQKICYDCATFTKPNQSSEAHNTNQTFSTHETKYQTIPGATGAEIEQLFRNCFLSSCHLSEEEDGDERKEREKGGFQLQQEIQVSLKGHFV